MKHIKMKYGFTLIELLVVVVIIAVLTAVAVPQYKKAVLKSRFSTVMPMAKAVADAQEVYYLGKNMYALRTDELDITPVQAEHAEVALNTEEEEDKYVYVSAWRTDFPQARYVMYQKHSRNFPGNIHCEALKTDEQAKALCKSFNGKELGTNGQYIAYLLTGAEDNGQFPPTREIRSSSCYDTAYNEGRSCTYYFKDGSIIGENSGNNISFNNGDYSVVGSGSGSSISSSKSAAASQVTAYETGYSNPNRFFYDEDGNLLHMEVILPDSNEKQFVDFDGNGNVVSGFRYDVDGFWRVDYYADGSVLSVMPNSYTTYYYDQSGTPFKTGAPDISSIPTWDMATAAGDVITQYTSKKKCKLFSELESCQP